VQRYVEPMQRHVLIHKKPTYFNIGDVEEFSYPTWQRAMDQTLIAECNLVLKPSCGRIEFSTSCKEKKANYTKPKTLLKKKNYPTRFLSSSNCLRLLCSESDIKRNSFT
jgi:hypothetical protein